MCIPSKSDPTMAAPGKHYMSVFIQYVPFNLANGGWNEERKQEFGRHIVDCIAELCDVWFIRSRVYVMGLLCRVMFSSSGHECICLYCYVVCCMHGCCKLSMGRWNARDYNVMCMLRQPAERFAVLSLLSQDAVHTDASILAPPT